MDDIRIDDWMRLDGPGFTVYGKVTGLDTETGQVIMVTSTIQSKKTPISKPKEPMAFKKIKPGDVPKKARLWILARISNPPEPGKRIEPNSIYPPNRSLTDQ